jgi:hypothetical protein
MLRDELDRSVGGRFRSQAAVIGKWLSLLLLLTMLACGSVPRRSVSGDMRITSGETAAFGRAHCYTLVQANDAGDKRDVSPDLSRLLAVSLPHLGPCGAERDGLSLTIIYEGGRGVCIDCVLPRPQDQWSGFGFLVVTDQTGREIASAEWQGEGATDVQALLRRFADDLVELLIGRVLSYSSALI